MLPEIGMFQTRKHAGKTVNSYSLSASLSTNAGVIPEEYYGSEEIHCQARLKCSNLNTQGNNLMLFETCLRLTITTQQVYKLVTSKES